MVLKVQYARGKGLVVFLGISPTVTFYNLFSSKRAKIGIKIVSWFSGGFFSLLVIRRISPNLSFSGISSPQLNAETLPLSTYCYFMFKKFFRTRFSIELKLV